MKIALVHEWLTVIGGSEKVFVQIAQLYPDADIFTLVARENTIEELGLKNRRVFTSFIQNLPFARKKYRSYLPFYSFAIEQFDLSQYDLVISSSHAVAKGVLTHSSQIHVCYCHSPIRYAWDLYHQYIREAKLDSGIKGMIAKYLLHRIRVWDVISSNRVDYFIANSDYIGRRIKKIYNRDSVTIYPNVAVDEFKYNERRKDYYFTCSRFVPYKKIDLIVEAFRLMPNKQLFVIGDGPDFKKIKKTVPPNVSLLGYQSFDVLKAYLSEAKAFVFAAEEDFGIIPVEAQAAGTPVIAYGKGGIKETVIDRVTGVFFYEQTEKAIINAIKDFEDNIAKFNHLNIVEHSKSFSTERFKVQFSTFIDSIIKPK